MQFCSQDFESGVEEIHDYDMLWTDACIFRSWNAVCAVERGRFDLIVPHRQIEQAYALNSPTISQDYSKH